MDFRYLVAHLFVTVEEYFVCMLEKTNRADEA
jgi:hypothetical protein